MIVGDWVKSKGIQFLLILLLGVSIIRALPLIRFYLGGWHSLVTLGRIDKIEVDRATGDLWGVGNHLYLFERQIGNTILVGKKIDWPPGVSVDLPIEICPAEQVWIRFYDKMLGYDVNSNSWETEVPEMDSSNRPIDCFHINQQIAILGNQAITYKDGNSWKEIQLPPHDESRWKGILQSNNGEWVLQIGYAFYQLDSNLENWELVTTHTPLETDEVFTSSSLVYTNDNYYWQEIYHDSAGRTLIVEGNERIEIMDGIPPGRNYAFNAVEDNFGRVWLTASDEAWIFEGQQFTQFDLPYRINFVRDIAVDPERELIYFLDFETIVYGSSNYNP